MVPQNPILLIMAPMPDSFRLGDLILPQDGAGPVAFNLAKFPGIEAIEAVLAGLSFTLTYHRAEEARQFFSEGKWDPIFYSPPKQPLPAIGISLSDHIISAKHDSTVNRTLLQLARIIGEALEAKSVVWQPAKLHIGFEYFAEATRQYSDGGPFPVLVQIAISESADGIFQTSGLSYFSGQEMRLSAPLDYPPNQVIKRLVRIAHDIASNGKIDTPIETEGFVPGEMLSLTPSSDLAFVDIAIAASSPRQLH